jgi:hypothetical protein
MDHDDCRNEPGLRSFGGDARNAVLDHKDADASKSFAKRGLAVDTTVDVWESLVSGCMHGTGNTAWAALALISSPTQPP